MAIVSTMNILFLLLTPLLSSISQAQSKAVFAHFMVGNVAAFTATDWETDISVAQAASIDAFALNIGSADNNNAGSLANAFKAANNKGFKLFFSFDYAAQGPWDQSSVISLITQYGRDNAYWNHNGKPLVSTFEGGDQASQWRNIKSQTDCFFIPDYSSMGAQAAVNTGVADGLFSWEAWPVGAADMTTDPDVSYRTALNGKPYMMPVSPWFFTNLPGWSKNWLWRGDDLWYDRWQQVLQIQPEFLQIISWNDLGESHYIGPLHDSEFGLFSTGSAPFNYAQNMPHDGWRKFLPFLISQYKNGAATVAGEGVVAWYRLNPGTACSSGGTTGNSANNGQQTVDPAIVSEDKIFYSALLASTATVTVSVGGVSLPSMWTKTPGGGGSGIYHGSVPFDGSRTGEVVVTVTRGTAMVARMNGAAITTACNQNIVNWNAWVGSSGD